MFLLEIIILQLEILVKGKNQLKSIANINIKVTRIKIYLIINPYILS